MKKFNASHLENLAKVMSLAKEIRQSQGFNKSLALKTAWAKFKLDNQFSKVDLEALRVALHQGSVLIQAKKTDKKKAGKTIIGEYTERVATLNPSISSTLNEGYFTKQSSPEVLAFVSLTDNQEWRSFRKDHILGFKIL